MTKINYLKRQKETLAQIKDAPFKPKLCMHVCCGVCSSYPLTFLCEYFEVTLYFNNSNIYPLQEYDRRLQELKDYLEKRNIPVQLIVTDYQNEAYTEKLSVLKDDKEGQGRCRLCYGLRMDEAYRYAHEHHFDYFCTVMSISRQKDSQILNFIGEQLSHKYPNTNYFFSDFKKENGNLISNQIAKEYDLYRQDYCGCIYSMRTNEEVPLK
ncbi:MAG: epoxyqueuosine reductase QueH [Erysipelotrichaceae bacterium]